MIKKEVYICPECQRRLKKIVRGNIMYHTCECGFEKKFAKLIYLDERECEEN